MFNKLSFAAKIAWILVIGQMIVIFALSSQVLKDSAELSKSVTQGIVKGVEKAKIIQEDKNKANEQIKISKWDVKVRDAAHSLVYLLLGIFTIHAFKKSGYKGFVAIAYSFLLCVVYAWTDEIHQAFVPGRGAEFIDISLDFIGAILGICIYNIGIKIIKIK